MLALRSGLDTREPAFDRKVDRPIVARLEVQKAVELDAAPVTAVERVRAQQVEGAADELAGAGFRHHQHHPVGHRLAEAAKEFAVEVRTPPLATSRVEVEAIERIPVPLLDARSR